MKTSLTPWDYLNTLSLTEKWTEAAELDGAALYRIADGHFVVLNCIAHDGHRGHQLLLRTLPPQWECFYSAVNPELKFEAFHYGPGDE
jgi:hypothetical protein